MNFPFVWAFSLQFIFCNVGSFCVLRVRHLNLNTLDVSERNWLRYDMFNCSVAVTWIKGGQFGRTWRPSFFSLLRRLMERCRKVRNQGEVKVTKKKTNGRKWSLSLILGYFPWGKNTFCYNKMETYLSGREDESPFRNSGDRISSSRRVTMSEKLGRLVLSLCQHSIIKLWMIFGHPCTKRKVI